MPRYAKPNQTVDDLKKKIIATLKSTSGDDTDDVGYAVYHVLYGYSTQKIKDDLSKIEVDGENAELIGEFGMPGTEDLEQFEMLNGVPIAWCAMGGDWELPIVVVLYIGDKGELRAYIPKDGNAYNKKAKAAFGNEDDEDFDEERDYVFDAELLREDVKARIQLKV